MWTTTETSVLVFVVVRSLNYLKLCHPNPLLKACSFRQCRQDNVDFYTYKPDCKFRTEECYRVFPCCIPHRYPYDCPDPKIDRPTIWELQLLYNEDMALRLERPG